MNNVVNGSVILYLFRCGRELKNISCHIIKITIIDLHQFPVVEYDYLYIFFFNFTWEALIMNSILISS